MNKTNLFTGALVALASTWTTGCYDANECGPETVDMMGVCVPEGGGTNCGEGTFESDGECVPVDPNDSTAPTTTASPAPGMYRDDIGFVTLTTDEPATIYYTTDGTDPTTASSSGDSVVVVPVPTGDVSVKFFAVDPAANQEALATADYIVDSIAPQPPISFSAAVGAAVDLSWTNPADADFTEVIVVGRTGAPTTDVPVLDTTYTAGDAIGDSRVIYVGTAEAASDAVGGDAVYYAAYARDQLGNQSVPARRVFGRPIGAQTAQFVIDPAAGTVVVGTQPNDFTIAGTASINGTTVTVDLSVTNDSIARLLFNPKLVLDTVSNGNVNEPPLPGGAFFMDFGPGALDMGVQRDASLVLTNVIDATITVDAHIEDAPAFFINGRGCTSMTSFDLVALRGGFEAPSFGAPGSDGCTTLGGSSMSPDGRLIAAGNRNNPFVVIFDTTTMQDVAQVQTGLGVGGVGGTVFSHDGSKIYALANPGHKTGGDGSPTVNPRVIVIDASTFAVIDSAEVAGVPSETEALFPPELSPDGTMLAFGNRRFDQGSALHVFDLVNMRELDADPSTTDLDRVTFDNDRGAPRHASWTVDGRSVVTGFTTQNIQDSGAKIVVALDDMMAPRLLTTAITEVGGGQAELTSSSLIAPDGKLWVLTNSTGAEQLLVYDIVADTEQIVQLPNANRAGALTMSPDGSTVVVFNRGVAFLIDATDPTAILQDSTIGSGQPRDHHAFTSPY